MKNSNDIIGNRTRDLPVCIAVPQPTVPPRALQSSITFSHNNIRVVLLLSAKKFDAGNIPRLFIYFIAQSVWRQVQYVTLSETNSANSAIWCSRFVVPVSSLFPKTMQ